MFLRFFHKLITVAAVLCFCHTTNAAISTNYAEASLDWSMVEFRFVDISNNFAEITDPGDFSDQETNNTVSIKEILGDNTLDIDFDVELDWSTATLANINYSNPPDITTAIASAQGDASSLTSSAELEAGIDAYIVSDVTRYGLFTADTYGLMLITAPFNLFAEVTDSNLYEAYAEVAFRLDIIGDGSADDIESVSSVFTTNSVLQSDNSGTLAIAIPFEAGDVITIEAYTYALVESSNPVPVPASFWLLGSTMLLLLSRKYK